MDEETKELQRDLRDILTAIARLDEQMKALAKIVDKVQAAEVKVAGLERDLKTVFIRYDQLSTELHELKTTIETNKKNSKEDRKWLLGFIPGIAAMVLSVLKAFKGG